MRIPFAGLSLLTASSVLTAISAADGDWSSNWDGAERTLTGAFQTDPNDPRSTMRGSGSITFGNGLAKMTGSPRLYISKGDGVAGWEDVEITVYGKWVVAGTSSASGLTLVTRSNHDVYKDSPCDAFGYYARIYGSTGQCSFQKEYYHSSTSGTVYSPSKRVDCFAGGLPLNQWVGMKFKATTTPGTSDVVLELYLDRNSDGNWVLEHSVTDTPGYWFSTSSTTVPAECPQNDGDTVTRPGNVSFLRMDGGEVHWANATMINTLSVANPPTTSPSKSPMKFTVTPTNSPVVPTSSPSKSPTGSPSPSICNNNGTCDPGEDCNNCSSDCASKTNGNPNSQYCCSGDVAPDCGSSNCNCSLGPAPTSTPPTGSPPQCVCSDYTEKNPCNGCGGGGICKWNQGQGLCLPR